MIFSKNSFYSLTAFLCFVPYISFLPLSTDMQPIALLFVMGSLLLERMVSVNSIIIGIFIYALISIIFINSTSFTFINQYVVLFLSYISFPLICLFGYNFKGSLIKVLNFSLLFYLFFGLIQVFYPYLFKTYVSLIYNQKVIETGIRGWSSITPEPTDLAFTCSIIIGLLLLQYSSCKNKSLNIISIIIGLFLVIGSLGVSGYLTTGLIFVMYFLTAKYSFKLKVTNLLGFCFICILGFVFLDGTRVVSILVGLIQDPLYIISNTSLFYRVFEHHIAILYAFENYFIPAGFNGFYDAVKTMGDYSNTLINSYSGRTEFISSYLNSPPEFAKNVFSRSLIENGFIFIVFLVVLLLKLFLVVKARVVLLFLVIFTLYLAQSFPLYYPPVWFMLGYIMRNFRKLNSNPDIYS